MGNEEKSSTDRNLIFALGATLLIVLLVIFCLNYFNTPKKGAVDIAVTATKDSISNSNTTLAPPKQPDKPSIKTWNILCKGNVNDIIPTYDGCAYVATTVIGGVDIFGMIDSLGETKWSVSLPEKAHLLLNTFDGNYLIIGDKSILIYDNRGNRIKQKNFNLGFETSFHHAIQVNNSDIILAGSANLRGFLNLSKGIVLKFDRNLNLIKIRIFGSIPTPPEYLGGSATDNDIGSNNEGFSKITSVVDAGNGNLFFTGEKRGHLWVGKITPDLEMGWEKNDYSFETNGNSSEVGTSIIKTNDNNYMVYGNYYLGALLLKLTPNGVKIWHNVLSGNYLDSKNSIVKSDGYYYVSTFNTFPTNSTSSPIASTMFKVSEQGDIANQFMVNSNGNKLLIRFLVGNSQAGLYTVGSDRNRNDNNGGYAEYSIISKLGKNGETGKTIAENINPTNQTILSSPVVSSHENAANNENAVETIDANPEFPGGTAALMNFLMRNIRYPEIDRDNNIDGEVIVKFDVLKDGSISNAHVTQSVSRGLDAEALRLVGLLPKFKPATKGSTPFNAQYTLPVVFKLQ